MKIGFSTYKIKIQNKIIEFIKYFAKQNGVLTDEKITNLDKIIDFQVAAGFLTWMTLGDTLKTSEEQHAWMIISSLLNTDKKSAGFYKGDLIKEVLSTLSLKDVQTSADNLREMKKKLFLSGVISDSEVHRVDELIEQGLIENNRINEQYPNRP